MDVSKALRELYQEKQRLDRTIDRLEARMGWSRHPASRSPRGRKSMGPEERLEVSARMTAYWAKKRKT